MQPARYVPFQLYYQEFYALRWSVFLPIITAQSSSSQKLLDTNLVQPGASGEAEKNKTDQVVGTILVWLEKEQQQPPEVSMGRAVCSLWAQWNRLEMVNNLLDQQWEEANTGASKKQSVVPQALVPEVILALYVSDKTR